MIYTYLISNKREHKISWGGKNDDKEKEKQIFLCHVENKKTYPKVKPQIWEKLALLIQIQNFKNYF
jgi:hypothetical protein